MTIPEIKQILRAARAAGRDYNACLVEVYINLEEITPEYANKNFEEFDRYEQIFCVR